MNEITREFLEYIGEPAEYFSEHDPEIVFVLAWLHRSGIDNACTIAQDLTGLPVSEEYVHLTREAFPEKENSDE